METGFSQSAASNEKLVDSGQAVHFFSVLASTRVEPVLTANITPGLIASCRKAALSVEKCHRIVDDRFAAVLKPVLEPFCLCRLSVGMGGSSIAEDRSEAEEVMEIYAPSAEFVDPVDVAMA